MTPSVAQCGCLAELDQVDAIVARLCPFSGEFGKIWLNIGRCRPNLTLIRHCAATARHTVCNTSKLVGDLARFRYFVSATWRGIPTQSILSLSLFLSICLSHLLSCMPTLYLISVLACLCVCVFGVGLVFLVSVLMDLLLESYL